MWKVAWGVFIKKGLNAFNIKACALSSISHDMTGCRKTTPIAALASTSSLTPAQCSATQHQQNRSVHNFCLTVS